MLSLTLNICLKNYKHEFISLNFNNFVDILEVLICFGRNIEILFYVYILINRYSFVGGACFAKQTWTRSPEKPGGFIAREAVDMKKE